MRRRSSCPANVGRGRVDAKNASPSIPPFELGTNPWTSLPMSSSFPPRARRAAASACAGRARDDSQRCSKSSRRPGRAQRPCGPLPWLGPRPERRGHAASLPPSARTSNSSAEDHGPSSTTQKIRGKGVGGARDLIARVTALDGVFREVVDLRTGLRRSPAAALREEMHAIADLQPSTAT